MNNVEIKLLKKIADIEKPPVCACNIRKNGIGDYRSITKNVNIVSKTDKSGIDIIVDKNTKGEKIFIPVIVTVGGLNDVVYNDFYIGEAADVTIVAGCGIHNDTANDSFHNGIHRFFIEENAKVKYIEKHYGEGDGKGKRILNPQTIIKLKKGSTFEMETVQIGGVDSTIRKTSAKLAKDTDLIITEKIMTHGSQMAKTIFNVKLDGENASTHVTSRSIAKEDSKQEFVSKIYGNAKCYGHVECDAIIMDNAIVKAIPEIVANVVDANLIHEATIGKIAGEQLTKLMTLGLTEKEAKNQIIKGFLR